MKKIKDFLLKTCGYAILILSVFYIFSAFLGASAYGILWDRFLVIIGYSLLISAADLLYSVLPIHKALCVLIHYALLLAGFIPIFIFLGAYASSPITPQRVFIAVAFFSILYFLAALAVWGVKALAAKVGKGSLAKEEKTPKKKKKTKPEYRSLYSDEG